MNREIKFRGWNEKKKVMVYNDEDESSDYWDGVCVSSVEMVNSEFKNVNNSYDWMQYTGLKDKNGKEIYEGDIVKFDRHGQINKETGEVFFDEGKFQVMNFFAQYQDIPSDAFSERAELEVIGNIYENKNLLIHE